MNLLDLWNMFDAVPSIVFISLCEYTRESTAADLHGVHHRCIEREEKEKTSKQSRHAHGSADHCSIAGSVITAGVSADHRRGEIPRREDVIENPCHCRISSSCTSNWSSVNRSCSHSSTEAEKRDAFASLKDQTSQSGGAEK